MLTATVAIYWFQIVTTAKLFRSIYTIKIFFVTATGAKAFFSVTITAIVFHFLFFRKNGRYIRKICFPRAVIAKIPFSQQL